MGMKVKIHKSKTGDRSNPASCFRKGGTFHEVIMQFHLFDYIVALELFSGCFSSLQECLNRFIK